MHLLDGGLNPLKHLRGNALGMSMDDIGHGCQANADGIGDVPHGCHDKPPSNDYFSYIIPRILHLCNL